MDGLQLENHPAAGRYEAKQDGKVVGFAEYRPVGGAVMFTHTEVKEDLEGQGVASQLVRYALEDVRKQNLLVIPMCPFVSAFIRRHPDQYLALVQPEHRGVFRL